MDRLQNYSNCGWRVYLQFLDIILVNNQSGYVRVSYSSGPMRQPKWRTFTTSWTYLQAVCSTDLQKPFHSSLPALISIIVATNSFTLQVIQLQTEVQDFWATIQVKWKREIIETTHKKWSKWSKISSLRFQISQLFMFLNKDRQLRLNKPNCNLVPSVLVNLENGLLKHLWR